MRPIVLLMILAAGSICGAQSTEPSTQPSDSPMRVRASDLRAAYRASRAKASEEYGGRTLCVSGLVRKTRTDPQGDPVVALADDDGRHIAVDCYFEKPVDQKTRDLISSLVPGDNVAVIGEVDGMVNVSVRIDSQSIDRGGSGAADGSRP